MDADNKCLPAAETIDEILKSGLRVTEDVQHYIDSTFSYPAPEELEELLNDESNPEKDTLVELLCFPDESIKIRIEDLPGRETYVKADEERIVDYLAEIRRTVPLNFEDGRESIMIEMPSWAIRAFVSRLNLTRHIVQELIDVVEQHVEASLVKRVKIRLRRRRNGYTEDLLAFLCTFFEKMRSQSKAFMNHVDFILRFLDEIKGQKDIFKVLIDKKKKCFHDLQRARKIEKQLQESNVETLLMQGIRIIPVDTEALQQEMETIDTVCRAVFGRTEFLGPVEPQVDVGSFNPDEDMEKVIRRFS